MKKLLLIHCMLFALYVFPQSSKDILLERDHEQLIERLKFMDYLNDVTMKLEGDIRRAGGVLEVPFYTYYNDSIVARNPYPSTNISSYLDYQLNEVPPTAADFIVRVYNRNALNLHTIIKRYGYPTTTKLNKYVKINPFRATFIIQKASDDWKKIFYPLIKEENRKGNLTEIEYTFCRFAFKNGIMTQSEAHEFSAIMKRHGYSPAKRFDY